MILRWLDERLSAFEQRLGAHPLALRLQGALPWLDPQVFWLGAVVLGLAAVAAKHTPPPRAVMDAGLVIGLIGLWCIGRGSVERLLYTLVAFLPFSHVLVGHMGRHIPALNLLNILLAWTFLLYALRLRATREPLLTAAPLNTLLLLFFGLSVLAFLHAGWSYGAWYLWDTAALLKRWLTPVALYFLMLGVVRDLRVLKTVLALIMSTVAAVALIAIWEYMGRGAGSLNHSRVGGIAGEPNLLAAFFVYYMFLFLAFFKPTSRVSWVMLVPFLLCARGIMVTFSRGGYLACAVGLLVACWLRSKRLFVAAVIIGVLMLAHPALLPRGIRFRLGQTLQPATTLGEPRDVTKRLDPSAAHRVELWHVGIQLVKAHPWLGVGFGAFRRFVPNYTQARLTYMDAHNIYLSIASEMGLPTLFVFFLLLGATAYYADWLCRHAHDGALRAMGMGFLPGLAGLLVANFFSPCMTSEEIISYFWILCALIMRGVLLERQGTSNQQPVTSGKGQMADEPSPVSRLLSQEHRPVKVMYVIDHLGAGGAQHQLVELVKAMPRPRFDVQVVSLSTEQVAYAQAIRDAGIPLTLIPHAGAWSWRTFFQLIRLFHQRQPDIVHTWLFTADLYGRLAAWMVRVPVVVSAVRSVEPDKPQRYVRVDRLLRRVTDAFTINARAIGEVLTARERVDRAKLHTIYNGVDLQVFDPTQQDGAVRRCIGVEAHAPLIGIIGRLVPVKDHATFLRAAALVAQQLPQARFLIVGSGPSRDELERLAHALGLHDRVHFLEGQLSVAETLAAMDVVVVTSRYEGCCNVILEAMAMGRPVVATAVGGNPELVIAGKTGLLVPPADPTQVSEAILHVVRQPQVAQAMGREGRLRAEQAFGLERMVRDTAALYGELLRASERSET